MMDPSLVFGDKVIALKLLEKQKEIRQREENVKLYKDTYDPRMPGALVKYQVRSPTILGDTRLIIVDLLLLFLGRLILRSRG